MKALVVFNEDGSIKSAMPVVETDEEETVVRDALVRMMTGAPVKGVQIEAR